MTATIFRCDNKTRAIIAFFPEKRCEVGMIYGYDFASKEERLFNDHDFRNTSPEYTPGLAMELVESIYGPVSIYTRDSESLRAKRWNL